MFLQVKKKMSQKNKQEKEIDLKDFTWEEEEFKFEPKLNRHKKFLKAKRKQLQKESYADSKKKFVDAFILDERKRFMSKVEQSLLQDYYDIEDEEDYEGYKIK